MNELISIIVPVYNVEPYLAHCLDSLLAQTDPDIEIIVVEDGSKDQSKQIVMDYESLHAPKIKAVYQSNQGLSAARNNGVRVSKGSYIFFVDSDDTVSHDVVQQMRKAMKQGVSIVETQAYFSYDDKDPIIKPYQTKHSITLQDLRKDKGALLGLALTAHSKLYRRELVDAVPFPVGLVHEDVFFTTCLYPLIEHVEKIPGGVYYHYQRSDSITNTFNQRIYDMLAIQQAIVQYYRMHHLYDAYHDLLERNALRTLVISTIGRKMGLLRRDCRQDRKERYLAIRSFIQKEYPRYRANPYLNWREKVLASVLLLHYMSACISWEIVPKVVKR